MKPEPAESVMSVHQDEEWVSRTVRVVGRGSTRARRVTVGETAGDIKAGGRIRANAMAYYRELTRRGGKSFKAFGWDDAQYY